jgi:hypothetical protein
MKQQHSDLLKRSTILSLSAFVLCFMLLFSSCSKPSNGATGPTGPTGNANVIYSAWFTPASYTKDTVFGTWGFYYDKTASDITAQMLDSATIITYGKLNGYVSSIWPTNQSAALPIAITYEISATVTNIDTWSALISPGKLRIQLQSSTNAYGSISNAHQFRYVIIPGTVLASRPAYGATSTPAIDYTKLTYEQVCSLFNIPE